MAWRLSWAKWWKMPHFMRALLLSTYAAITSADWIAYDKRFQEAYVPNDLIGVVWRQIENTVAYAYAG